LAGVYELQGQVDRARVVYEKALERNPKAVSVLMRLAQLHAERLNNRVKALELAKQAGSLAPDDPQIAYALGRMAYQARDFVWAHSLLQGCAAKLPGDPLVHYSLGLAAYNLGRIAASETSMRRALEINPAFPQAAAARLFLELVDLGRRPSEIAAAEPRLNEALKASPDLLPALFLAAQLKEQRGQPKEAIQDLERILERYPGFGPATGFLARLYAAMPGNDQKAYDLAVRARNALPTDVDVAKTLGQLAYRKKDYSYAVRLLEESLRARATDAELYYYLGLSQGQLKQKNESKQSLTKALAMNGQHPLAAEARRVLGELK
jgi:tetratricopeptide (TPR) repeat protein